MKQRTRDSLWHYVTQTRYNAACLLLSGGPGEAHLAPAAGWGCAARQVARRAVAQGGVDEGGLGHKGEAHVHLRHMRCTESAVHRAKAHGVGRALCAWPCGVHTWWTPWLAKWWRIRQWVGMPQQPLPKHLRSVAG